MSEQLTRIEAKVDRIEDHIVELKESRGEQKAKLEGHSTQIALLWTLVFLIAGSAVAAWFNL